MSSLVDKPVHIAEPPIKWRSTFFSENWFSINEKIMLKITIAQVLGYMDNPFLIYLSICIDFRIFMGHGKSVRNIIIFPRIDICYVHQFI